MVGYAIKLCEYGYCLYTGNEPLNLYAGTTIALGWGGIIIPMFIGLLVGFGIGYILAKNCK